MSASGIWWPQLQLSVGEILHADYSAIDAEVATKTRPIQLGKKSGSQQTAYWNIINDDA